LEIVGNYLKLKKIAEINLINSINVVLKERHEIETNFNHLHLKLNQMKSDEADRKDKVMCAHFYAIAAPFFCAQQFFPH
jgi:hypothetical protein